MKTKLLLLAFTLLLVISCQTKEQLMQKNITAELLNVMDDPSTFEFVSMNIKKTITVGERRKFMNEDKLKDVVRLGAKDLEEQMKKEIEFLKYKDDNLEAVYYVDFIARASNKFGAIIKVKYSATVLNDDNLTVVHFKSMN